MIPHCEHCFADATHSVCHLLREGRWRIRKDRAPRRFCRWCATVEATKRNAALRREHEQAKAGETAGLG